ncbi:MAG: DUF632 domain-containing protein [Spirochaetes bacterium]|nr:DUF632 domain-containing protein [Spirochaetota bacterium]
MKEWIIRLCYPALRGANIILFACFVPRGRKLYFWEKPLYKELVKMVQLEYRLLQKIHKRFVPC